MPKSFADVMKAETNGRRRGSRLLCFGATLSDEFRELGAQLTLALNAEGAPKDDPQRKPMRRLSEGVGSTEIMAKIDALIADNPDAFYEAQYEQLRRDEWRKLRAAHAPRDDERADRGLPFNSDTFPRAVVAASLIDPEPTEDVLNWLDDVMSAGEWQAFASVLWEHNEGERPAPKAGSAAASAILASFVSK